MILGIDEVGRGPWAGPLVVGAVVLGEAQIAGLTDSKKLTAKKRDALDILIREQAAGWGLGWVHAEELDELGLAESLRVATIRAVEAVKAPYHEIIIDGTINFLKDTSKGRFVTTLAKADLLIPSVSAASIIAKVARDAYMAQQDGIHPEYSFAKHVGYGTALHRAAIDELGITPLHRKSFAPIAKIIGAENVAVKTVASQTSKTIGDAAEIKATEYLVTQGYKILDKNWKTKWCEIDIVAQKDSIVYFVEVKYRSNHTTGDGFAAITKTKLQQMTFAAEYYQATRANTSADVLLAVVSVSDTSIDYLEIK